MSKWNNEEEARDYIKSLVSTYYKEFKSNNKTFEPGDRINYAGRVFDENEMFALTDAMLSGLQAVGFARSLRKTFQKI